MPVRYRDSPQGNGHRDADIDRLRLLSLLIAQRSRTERQLSPLRP